MMEEFILTERHVEYILDFYKDPLFTTGPIFGQCDGEKKYMVHVAQAADRTAAVVPPVETIEQIDVNILAEHARQAIRVLPGGMSVLGIFMIGPKLVSQGKAESLTWDVDLCQSLKELIYMCSLDLYQKGIPSNRKLILLSARGLDGKLECSSCEVLEEGITVKPIPCRVVSEIIWHEIAAMVNLDLQMLIPKRRTGLPLWEQLKPMLHLLQEVTNSAGITFPLAGIVEDKAPVSELLKKQREILVSVRGGDDDEVTDQDNKIITVDVMFKEDLDAGRDVKIVHGEGSKLILSGIIVCRTYVHADADVKMCKQIINEDIMHSLIARLEMHCDSLIEEEPDDVCVGEVVFHEPPRRMMVRLPCSEVLFSDYLFPGELVTEAKQSLQSLLDVSVRDVDILHTSAGLSEFECDELKIRTVEQTPVWPARKDILQFILVVLAILAPVVAFFIFHHQK